MTVVTEGRDNAQMRERIVKVATDVAVSHGLSQVPSDHVEHRPISPLMAYWIKMPPEWGSAWVGVRVVQDKPGAVQVWVMTFPAFDYGIAAQLRSDLDHRLRADLGDAVVRGF